MNRTTINADMTEIDRKFEELGWEKSFHPYALVYENCESSYPQRIEFIYDNQTVCCECYVRERWRAMEIDKTLANLIVEKVKELNW